LRKHLVWYDIHVPSVNFNFLSFEKVGSKATPAKLHCLCTHLSAFGGDLFVAPNPIDFDKVFAEFGKLGETGNFVVLSFVCVVFGLYAIGLVFARRADKKDDFEVQIKLFTLNTDLVYRKT